MLSDAPHRELKRAQIAARCNVGAHGLASMLTSVGVDAKIDIAVGKPRT
jgi:hypothetical protein